LILRRDLRLAHALAAGRTGFRQPHVIGFMHDAGGRPLPVPPIGRAGLASRAARPPLRRALRKRRGLTRPARRAASNSSVNRAMSRSSRARSRSKCARSASDWASASRNCTICCCSCSIDSAEGRSRASGTHPLCQNSGASPSQTR
jgi:hypothetical protein